MKSIKYKPEYDNCRVWIRIDYLSSYSHGTMIMKKSAYEDNQKKINKALKDCHIARFIDDYHVTMKDIILSVIHVWEHRLSQITARYNDYQRRFGNHDGWTQDAYITMVEISDKIKRLKGKVERWKDYRNCNV